MKTGEKYGCLEIMDEGEEYTHFIDSKIDKSEDKHLERAVQKYKCKCRKCGKIRYYTKETIQTEPKFCYYPLYISDKFTYSTRARNATYRKRLKFENNETICFVSDKKDYVPSDEYCGKWDEKRRKELAKQAEKDAAVIAALPRQYAKNYDVDYSGSILESLEVLDCVNDRLESAPDFHYNQRHKKVYSDITVYKQYRCRCYLCEKEKLITCDQVGTKSACCVCHQVSSFQWTVNNLFLEHKIPYRVEVSFPGLYGVQGKKLLQFDFAVYNEDGTIKCLIECQGKQHEEPVEEFGGVFQYEMQRSNDELKREYVKTHNIPYIEISYKDKKYEKIMEILMIEGILN